MYRPPAPISGQSIATIRHHMGGDNTAAPLSPASALLQLTSACVGGGGGVAVRVWSREPVEGYRPPTLAGHRDNVVAVFFAEGGPHKDDPPSTDSRAPSTLYTMSRDGALFHWQQLEAPRASLTHPVAVLGSRAEGVVRLAAPCLVETRPGHLRGGELTRGCGYTVDNAAVDKVKAQGKEGGAVGMARHSGQWRILHKHFFMQQGKLTCADYHKGTGMLVAGFSTGIFTLYKMPGFEMVHTLSVSRERLSSVKFSDSGDWLALGCATLGQLLVWEWRSETYILKQQGHYFDIAHAAYSPDGAFIATGADDNKLKVCPARPGDPTNHLPTGAG
jgi:periodic tryptophan protein 2